MAFGYWSTPLEAKYGYEFRCTPCDTPTHEETVPCAVTGCQNEELCIDCRHVCDLCNLTFCHNHVHVIERNERPDLVICRGCAALVKAAA